MNFTSTKPQLVHAEKRAMEMFRAIEEHKLIVAGKTEGQLNEEVAQLAASEFGIDKHWHKKIVRAGINTTAVYTGNPPDRVLVEDEILFIDYGPIVEGYESDIGRTYVLGDDPMKKKLQLDVEKAWFETCAWYQQHTTLRASELFQYVCDKAEQYGWVFGGEIAGHIVGAYPHEQPLDPKSVELDVHPDNHHDMFMPDSNGNQRSWILEIHFIDKDKTMGGYFEQLMS